MFLGGCACSVLYSFPSNIGKVVESPIECVILAGRTLRCVVGQRDGSADRSARMVGTN